MGNSCNPTSASSLALGQFRFRPGTLVPTFCLKLPWKCGGVCGSNSVDGMIISAFSKSSLKIGNLENRKRGKKASSTNQVGHRFKAHLLTTKFLLAVCTSQSYTEMRLNAGCKCLWATHLCDILIVCQLCQYVFSCKKRRVWEKRDRDPLPGGLCLFVQLPFAWIAAAGWD